MSLSTILPSIKGGTILLASYALNFISDTTRSQTLWLLTMILTALGIYDFWLKIRYKHRKEREARKERNGGSSYAGEEAEKQTKYNEDGSK